MHKPLMAELLGVSITDSKSSAGRGLSLYKIPQIPASIACIVPTLSIHMVDLLPLNLALLVYDTRTDNYYLYIPYHTIPYLHTTYICRLVYNRKTEQKIMGRAGIEPATLRTSIARSPN
ncbi:hypothetical protein ACN38_g2076 [Penicillium nordicum]|uniref:Uncharacterized protein n=1 Tax=Penicillium nordicum TaxID=229535 RepID=A0A0M8P7W5_9EURO|nr:hypothetical protein ACN38_g2076 [Penicillium nordicum]